MNIQNDGWRSQEMIQTACDARHPYSRFSIPSPFFVIVSGGHRGDLERSKHPRACSGVLQEVLLCQYHDPCPAQQHWLG